MNTSESNLGFSILPKARRNWRLKQPGIKPTTCLLVDDLISLPSCSHSSPSLCHLLVGGIYQGASEHVVLCVRLMLEKKNGDLSETCRSVGLIRWCRYHSTPSKFATRSTWQVKSAALVLIRENRKDSYRERCFARKKIKAHHRLKCEKRLFGWNGHRNKSRLLRWPPS